MHQVGLKFAEEDDIIDEEEFYDELDGIVDDQPEVPEREGDEELYEDDLGDPNEGNTQDQGPEYPSQAALDLWAALENKDSDDKTLDALFHTLLLSLFTQMVDEKEDRFHTVIEAFLLAINTRADGTIQPAVNITPDLSKLQYGILFCILKEAIASGNVGSKLEELLRWYDPVQISAFASVRYYQHIGWVEVKSHVGVARVLFYDNGPRFSFNGLPSSADLWIQMTHSIYKEARQILTGKLLFGLSEDILGILVDAGALVDGLQNQTPGYGFAPQGVNPLAKVMKVLFKYPAFIEQFRSSDYLSYPRTWIQVLG
ncbi:hypothetical protein B0H10DRAFT_1960105 [Mycena sp. CBHHK59/15]|nr:hypothetical protein B0H10DRAFT_1960105 [Mycena sp. CBHHK59/15]